MPFLKIYPKCFEISYKLYNQHVNLFIYFIVVQVQLSPFPPHHTLSPHPFPPATLEPTPFGFVHVSFIHVPWWPFLYYPLLSLSPLSSGSCQFVLYFNVSGYNLLACLFCWLGSTYRWDHKQINKQQVLAKLWRKGNLNALLVGMQTGETTVENSMEFPQKTKNGTAFWPSNTTVGIIH